MYHAVVDGRDEGLVTDAPLCMAVGAVGGARGGADGRLPSAVPPVIPAPALFFPFSTTCPGGAAALPSGP